MGLGESLRGLESSTVKACEGFTELRFRVVLSSESVFDDTIAAASVDVSRV